MKYITYAMNFRKNRNVHNAICIRGKQVISIRHLQIGMLLNTRVNSVEQDNCGMFFFTIGTN